MTATLTRNPYGFGVSVPLEFEAALKRTVECLKEEGFGVLTEIDVRQTMKDKLDVEFRRYRILGACNPPLAHEAFTVELEIGLLLPCNVIVYEKEGGSQVSFMDPLAALGVVGNAELEPVAEEARIRLERVARKLLAG